MSDVIRAALSHISQLLLKYSDVVAATAFDSLSESMYSRVSGITGPAFHLQAAAERIAAQASWTSFMESKDAGNDGASSIQDLIRLFPDLNKDLRLGLAHWLSFINQMFLRLRTSGLSEFGKVSHITVGVGDWHDRRGAACKLEYDSGAIRYYKPRSMFVDCAVRKFCEYLVRLKVISYNPCAKVSAFADFGFSELIEAKSFECVMSVERYYFRLGEFIALAAYLGADDLHCENIIAFQDGPVCVDWETLGGSECNPQMPIDNYLSRSGLFSAGSLIKTVGGLEFDHVGNSINVPELRGQPMTFNKFLSFVFAGLASTCEKIMSLHRNDPMAVRRLISLINSHESRMVLRPTTYYHILLYRFSELKYESCSKFAAMHIAEMLRSTANSHITIAAVNFEVEDIAKGAVPSFYSTTSGLKSSRGKVVYSKLQKQWRPLIFTKSTASILEKDFIRLANPTGYFGLL